MNDKLHLIMTLTLIFLVVISYPCNLFSQTSDVTAPTLMALSFEPTSIDTSSGPATVDVSLAATDDLSGLYTVQVGFSNPSGSYNAGGSGSLSGLNDATTFTVTFPRFSEAGIWTLNFVFLVDQAQNSRTITTSELVAMGYPTELVVESETYIDPILDFFDESVADGTLEGSGRGNSANGRLNAPKK